jgi:hypothetical protein
VVVDNRDCVCLDFRGVALAELAVNHDERFHETVN